MSLTLRKRRLNLVENISHSTYTLKTLQSFNWYEEFCLCLQKKALICTGQSTLPGSPKPADYAAVVVEKINQLCFPENISQFIPYVHKQAVQKEKSSGKLADRSSNDTNPYVIYNPQVEFTRMGLLSRNEVQIPCSHNWMA